MLLLCQCQEHPSKVHQGQVQPGQLVFDSCTDLQACLNSKHLIDCMVAQDISLRQLRVYVWGHINHQHDWTHFVQYAATMPVFCIPGLIWHHQTPVNHEQVLSLSCCMHCTLLFSLTERNECTSSFNACGCMWSCMQTCCPLSDLAFYNLLRLRLLHLSCKVLQTGCMKVWSRSW